MDRRVAVTGIGLVTPVGIGHQAAWEALLAGRSGAAPITLFDASQLSVQFACEVKNFEPTRWIDKRLNKTLDRFVQFAVVAAQLASDDAGLAFDEREAERVGVFVGSGFGGLSTVEATQQKIFQNGAACGLSPYCVPSSIINIAPAQISIRFGAKGPILSQVSACSSSAHSIGEAYHCIMRGDADVMFAGGSEAVICQLGVKGFNAARALSRRNDDPQGASRPFDAERDGFVLGEGGGVLILESLERAQARGARIYAELAGYGLTSDAYHITAPDPSGEGARRCLRMALNKGRINREDVVYVNAHGTSTRFNDAVETHALKVFFGEHAKHIKISSTKSMTGHLLGGAGAAEAAFTVLAIHQRVIPPTINYEHADPDCDLDYTPNHPRELPVSVAISNSFGFGGTNACLAFRQLASN